MRGTAAVLVCLISLHYLSVTDAYSARFTSENGMLGREHEDKNPRRSIDEKRGPSPGIPEPPDYDNWEQYGGIPNIPYGHQYRDEYLDTDLDAYTDEDSQPALPSARSTAKKRGSSVSPEKIKRRDYDDWEYYSNPKIPSGYQYRDADIELGEIADADGNGFSETLKQLLRPIVEATRKLWEKLSGKSLDSVGEESAAEPAKRENEPLKKAAMENRDGEDPETADQKNDINNPITFFVEIAKKALDFAYRVIDKIDVSKFTEETQKLKKAILDIVKKAREALDDLLHNIAQGIESGGDWSPPARRARSIRKRGNALDSNPNRSKKRSNVRNSLPCSTKKNAAESDMATVVGLMTEMEECIKNLPTRDSSLLGTKCIVGPLMRAFESPEQRDGNDSTTNADSRSDAIEPAVNLRRLNFPWGTIFLIPFYNGQLPDNSTVPPFLEKCINTTTTVTTTVTEPPTTTTTDALPNAFVPEDLDKADPSGSKYKSKYDNDF